MNHTRNDFPEGFVFGAATSSYQIEGHAFGGAGETHWDSFAATEGNVVNAEHGGRACEHYYRFEEDLDLMRDAGFDAYRFSTSWARVLPEGRGAINQEGLDFYDRLVDAMLERDLKPMATLYHWELPSPLADLGGWTNRDIASWFADFTEIVMQRIGDRIYSAAPINEPWCVSWLSHYLGQHAPGKRDIRSAARAMHHVLLAHGRAIEAMRGLGVKNSGCVFNMEWAQPANDTAKDHEAAATFDSYYNHFFLSGVFKKAYPALALEGLEAHLPKGWDEDFDIIGQKLDWCGINYYTRKVLTASDGPWPHHQDAKGPLPKTQMGWEIYPDGLYKFLIRTAKEYSGDLPIFVTENGMANDDPITNGVIDDKRRIEYFNSHLQAVKHAIDEGVPVGGYVAWSLLDNYEWALGYEKRFGLVHVDFDTMKRTPKASWEAFQKMLAG